jgi:hypothetical protein
MSCSGLHVTWQDDDGTAEKISNRYSVSEVQ